MIRNLFITVILMVTPLLVSAQTDYIPTQANLESRAEFSDMRFGIFIHWGIYSLFGQGEWYMQNANIDWQEYEKAASAFYPHRFSAKQWVSAIKASGARYITFTSRHHDGFSMWDTDQSDFNIVDATPYGKDVIRMLADECHAQGVRLHLYYSHLDWRRADYPIGRTGRGMHRNLKPNWISYLSFMKDQLTELLTRYGDIGAIWFDGVWDHDQDATPFDWKLGEQYALIHSLQPRCLVGNNHHSDIVPGEDIQIFERDVPGQNKAGFSEGQVVSDLLPLETCQTMNGMWGYKITDQDYKSVDELIRLLISTSAKGANLLLNIGPQPNGELPATALERLKGMGQWLSKYGESIYGTQAGDIAQQEWGATTRKGNTLYVHITDKDVKELNLTLACKVKKAICLNDNTEIKVKQKKGIVTFQLPNHSSEIDYIIKLTTK